MHQRQKIQALACMYSICLSFLSCDDAELLGWPVSCSPGSVSKSQVPVTDCCCCGCLSCLLFCQKPPSSEDELWSGDLLAWECHGLWPLLEVLEPRSLQASSSVKPGKVFALIKQEFKNVPALQKRQYANILHMCKRSYDQAEGATWNSISFSSRRLFS